MYVPTIDLLYVLQHIEVFISRQVRVNEMMEDEQHGLQFLQDYASVFATDVKLEMDLINQVLSHGSSSNPLRDSRYHMEYLLQMKKLIPNLTVLLSEVSKYFATSTWHSFYAYFAKVIIRLLQTQAGYMIIFTAGNFVSLIIKTLSTYVDHSDIKDANYMPLSMLKHKYDSVVVDPMHLATILKTMQQGLTSCDLLLASQADMPVPSNDLAMDSVLHALSFPSLYGRLVKYFKTLSTIPENDPVMRTVSSLVSFPYATTFLFRLTKDLYTVFTKNKASLPSPFKIWLDGFLMFKTTGVSL